MKTIFTCTMALLGMTSSMPLFASPRPLPYTYPYETLGEDELEVELYGDMTPLRVAGADLAKAPLWEPSYVLQSEIEYGLSDRLELGFYQVFEVEPQGGGTNSMIFDGFKWRVRTRLGEVGEWPVDVALYVELETFHDEISLEEKVILAKRLGRWHWMANLWVEQSERRPFDASVRSFHPVLNPTTGLTYQVTPVFQPGVEYWARGEIDPSGQDSTEIDNRRIHQFLGPTAHLEFGKLWWSAGVYANLNSVKNPRPGESYGPVWIRTVLGLNL